MVIFHSCVSLPEGNHVKQFNFVGFRGSNMWDQHRPTPSAIFVKIPCCRENPCLLHQGLARRILQHLGRGASSLGPLLWGKCIEMWCHLSLLANRYQIYHCYAMLQCQIHLHRWFVGSVAVTGTSAHPLDERNTNHDPNHSVIVPMNVQSTNYPKNPFIISITNGPHIPQLLYGNY